MVATDEDALRGFRLITQLEGIIPGKFYFFGVVWFLYCGFVDLWIVVIDVLISHFSFCFEFCCKNSVIFLKEKKTNSTAYLMQAKTLTLILSSIQVSCYSNLVL